jgi:hypothetical protein
MLETKPWIKLFLFAWRSRSNCFQCHYQRLYEWVGLLEHHPDLFDRAEEIERVYGGLKSDYRMWQVPMGEAIRNVKDFTFNPGYSLSGIRKEADRIFKARVNQVYQEVVQNRQKPLIQLDLLSNTSCGALCGK